MPLRRDAARDAGLALLLRRYFHDAAWQVLEPSIARRRRWSPTWPHHPAHARDIDGRNSWARSERRRRAEDVGCIAIKGPDHNDAAVCRNSCSLQRRVNFVTRRTPLEDAHPFVAVAKFVVVHDRVRRRGSPRTIRTRWPSEVNFAMALMVGGPCTPAPGGWLVDGIAMGPRSSSRRALAGDQLAHLGGTRCRCCSPRRKT